jgi:plasmid stabilization system protein ParE
MDCAVIYSEAALADLHEITEFIAKDNAEVAARFANRLVGPGSVAAVTAGALATDH